MARLARAFVRREVKVQCPRLPAARLPAVCPPFVPL
jgi:hypothetical protein